MRGAVRIETACALAGRVTISPAQGATRIPLVGSMASPSPSMRPPNTGSGTSSSVPHQPSNGARICRIDIRRLLPDLEPVDRPQGIQPRTRETQTQVMAARQTGQSLRPQGGHAPARGLPRERPDSDRRRLDSVALTLA